MARYLGGYMGARPGEKGSPLLHKCRTCGSERGSHLGKSQRCPGKATTFERGCSPAVMARIEANRWRYRSTVYPARPCAADRVDGRKIRLALAATKAANRAALLLAERSDAAE